MVYVVSLLHTSLHAVSEAAAFAREHEGSDVRFLRSVGRHEVAERKEENNVRRVAGGSRGLLDKALLSGVHLNASSRQLTAPCSSDRTCRKLVKNPD